METQFEVALPEFLTEGTKNGTEISITGKWIPTKKSSFFRKSEEAKEMLKEWESIHNEARGHKGMLHTEINPAIGQETVLIHHIFQNEDALIDYFNTTATKHMQDLTAVAKPDVHLIRGVKISDRVKAAISAKKVQGNYGEYLFGFVRNDYQRPNPEKAVQVTAKWTCNDEGTLKELSYWWQQVATEAYTLEQGMVRFEAYRVIGENALIIHETFEDSDELKFHLTKGTAEKYKKDIDKIAFPENYFFRGPVSWMIRTYSKFMHLPATYTRTGKQYIQETGTWSEGIIKNTQSMTNQNIMVVYQWTAKAGKSEALKAIYQDVTKQMQETEPHALKVNCYFDESKDTLVVYDLFKDGAALGQHLGTTAAGHFPFFA